MLEGRQGHLTSGVPVKSIRIILYCRLETRNPVMLHPRAQRAARNPMYDGLFLEAGRDDLSLTAYYTIK
jgi:hypothetical protein